MGKYDRLSRQLPQKTSSWRIHPIWRGIGCILFLILPIVAFVAANLLLEMNSKQGWIPIPAELNDPYVIPQVNYTISNFFATLMLTALILLLGFGLIMVLYSIIFSILGPPKYGPMDAPPIRRKSRPSR